MKEGKTKDLKKKVALRSKKTRKKQKDKNKKLHSLAKPKKEDKKGY